jgi:hypothetical protein
MFQTLTGLEYLKAEIACKADKAFEKATWNERLAQFDKLDLGSPSTYKNASNPIGLRAAVIALGDVLQAEPTGYMISLDACSSGIQILSLLVSCPKSFDLCGGNHDFCVDSYTTLYDAMDIGDKLTRKEVKNCIMTSFYGSTATPERIFGDDVELFYETVEREAPGAWQLNLALQETWNEIETSDYAWTLPDNFHAYIETKESIYLPFAILGEKYELLKKIDGRPKFHKGLGPNVIHSVDALIVREMFRRCMFSEEAILRLANIIMGTDTYQHPSIGAAKMVEILWDHYQRSGFLSTRILDYLDSDNITLVDELVIAKLISTLPNASFEITSNHDCFRCHPNYGNDLRRQYNHILADINDSNMLQTMVHDLTGKNRRVKKVGTIARDVILDSNYSLA